jgi:hypothetical protein
LDDGSDDDSEGKKKSGSIRMKRNNNGYPILPSMEEIDGYELVYKKQLIGTFIGDVYRS